MLYYTLYSKFCHPKQLIILFKVFNNSFQYCEIQASKEKTLFRELTSHNVNPQSGNFAKSLFELTM